MYIYIYLYIYVYIYIYIYIYYIYINYIYICYYCKYKQAYVYFLGIFISKRSRKVLKIAVAMFLEITNEKVVESAISENVICGTATLSNVTPPREPFLNKFLTIQHSFFFRTSLVCGLCQLTTCFSDFNSRSLLFKTILNFFMKPSFGSGFGVLKNKL